MQTTLSTTPNIFASGTMIIDGNNVETPQRLTVRQLVAEQPRRARVFEKYGIAYCCCSANKTVLDASREKGVSPDEVLRDLGLSDAQPGGLPPEERVDWAQSAPGELRRHIVDVHHAFLRAELPRLSYLVDRVANRHGELYPELWELQGVFEEFKEELEWHMEREETRLFPLLEQLDHATDHSEALRNAAGKQISLMEQEHVYFCNALSNMGLLTGGFHPPQTACNTFRVLLDSLSAMADDLILHMHEENDILFPLWVQ